MRDLALRAELAEHGVHFLDTAVTPMGQDAAEVSRIWDAWRRDVGIAADANPHLVGSDLRMSLDAQPQTITAASAGIPAFLTNVVSPEVIRIVTQPMRFAEIFGERKEGDWTRLSTMFPVVEGSGSVASYNDFSNNGNVDANINYVARQAYHFQTIEKWGERHAAIIGLAGINYKAELDTAAALVMNKFRNRVYAYGIAGLQNYGAINDPSLIAPIAPATKAAGGTSWNNATAQEIFQDVLALYAQLNLQMGGNLDMDQPMELILSTTRQPALAKVSQFNVSALTTIRQTFPNLTIRTAPEYSTGGGELMQLVLRNHDGIQTAYAAFTEKMRTHPLVTQLSSWMQKLSGGVWGTIIRRPIAIAQMLGI